MHCAIVEELHDAFDGVSNGYMSEVYESITGEKAEVIGEVTKLFKCPCCLHNTLTEQYNLELGEGYDICRYCKWEDDGTTDIYSVRSINNGSIADYRKRIANNSNFYLREKWLT